MKFALIFTLLTSLVLSTTAECAATDDATAQLKKWVDEVISVASHAPNKDVLRTKVRPILEHCINFEIMTRRAVGPGWRQFTPDQQKEANKLFTTLIIRTYTAKFTVGENPSITFKSASSPSPGHVEVPTTSSYKGSHYDVTYRLEITEGWHITDVVIVGVSLIANYRTQFDSEFQQGGANAVLKALHHSVEAPE